jgi:hypothetical protein
MPFVFCFLVAWYLVNWVEKAVVNGAARVTGRAADRLAGAADRLGERGQGIRDRATAAGEKLRGRPAPATPRTRAGQRIADKAAHATGRALGGIAGWLRIMWADAKAAAESAQERRAAGQGMWWHWPTGDDPQAPIQATAERLDQPQADTPPASNDDDRDFRGDHQAHVEAGKCAWIEEDGRTWCWGWRLADSPYCTDHTTHTTAGPAGTEDVTPDPSPEPEPVDEQPPGSVQATAERLDQDQPAQPDQLASGPLAITDGRENTMETAAESGLGAYLSYSNSMAASCQDGISSVESTIAALESQDWSGTPVSALKNAQEALSNAATAFNEANSAFQEALAVREQYQANTHAGTKESVLAD